MARNLLYIHQYFNTLEMSGGTRSYEMARRLVDDGYSVTMLTADRTKGFGMPKRETIEGFDVIWVPGAYHNSYGPFRKAMAFLLFSLVTCFYVLWLKFDVIFATSTPLTTGIPALVAKKIRSKPYVFEVRDLWPEMPIALGTIRNPRLIRVLKWLEAKIYVNAHALVGLSPGMSEGIADVLAEKGVTRPIYTAPNACDFDNLCSPLNEDYAARRADMRAKLNLTNGQTMLLYAGTFGLLNDVEYLLTLAKRTKDNADLFYVIVGGGINDQKIRDFVAAEKLQNVKIQGRVPKREIVDYFAACDAGLSLFIDLPEMEKNSANKFFDTLAAGKPVLINYGGWQADFVNAKGVGQQLSRDIEEAAGQMDVMGTTLAGITAQMVLDAAQDFSRQSVYEKVRDAIQSMDEKR
ncbi:glycosyltransferase family 4 protein [Octadecabacter sp. G9-8]|uniref:Glycosyltransferase family 4 protein n=1 Tax=Octadecabacter dasysiphoniae TaxID=2909341 RepID=A0ABS9CX16_9RHOB|nr:glycosyltransferase family 4 protein [Octadecabacter dasysiphoniae]MCF2870944.1 glycosyltransferase family 4 protein [Octadecabacter dasysiphoniae]